MKLGGVVARMEQQVNGLPFVRHGGVAQHNVIADVGLCYSASQPFEAEVRSHLPYWEGVRRLVALQGHTVQLAKMLCNKQIGLQDPGFGISLTPKPHAKSC